MRTAADSRIVPPEQPPPAERTSTGVTTGFGGPAAPPAVEGSSDATARVGRRSSTRASTIRTFAAFIVGKSPSKHSDNGRPPPTEVTMHDSPYDLEEEVRSWFAQEVAIEHEDFVDEILEESPEAIQTTTETSLAIGRDSNAISGGGSNANSGGGSGTVDSQQANSRDSNAKATKSRLIPSRQSILYRRRAGALTQPAAEDRMRTAADSRVAPLKQSIECSYYDSC
jgi:hypothetical protein